MAEPLQENARLAERLLTIGKLLRDGAPPARSNGHVEAPHMSPEDEALAAWAKNYETTEEGKRVSALIGARTRTVLTEKHLEAIARAFVPFLKEAVAQALVPVFDRIVELEARVIELRQQPSPKYRRVWSEGVAYFAGDFVSDHGGVWHCEKACTNVRPGTNPEFWTLAIPRGRRGRDARDSR
jgi:hypothetical protein